MVESFYAHTLDAYAQTHQYGWCEAMVMLCTGLTQSKAAIEPVNRRLANDRSPRLVVAFDCENPMSAFQSPVYALHVGLIGPTIAGRSLEAQIRTLVDVTTDALEVIEAQRILEQDEIGAVTPETTRLYDLALSAWEEVRYLAQLVALLPSEASKAVRPLAAVSR